MSKHFNFQTNTAGEKLLLEVGFDGPTHQFFANISFDGEMIYSSLADPAESKDSSWLATVTATHGLVIPHPMMEKLAREAMFGGSNAIVEHPDHVQTEIESLLLQIGCRQQMPSHLPFPKDASWVFYTDAVRGIGEYVLAQSDLYEIYLPRMICGLKPSEDGEWPVLTAEDLSLQLELASAKLQMGAFKERGEGLRSVLERLLGFVPVKVVSESKLYVIYSEKEFEHDGSEGAGFFNKKRGWTRLAGADLYAEPNTAPAGGVFITFPVARAIADGELQKRGVSLAPKSISDDDLCATCIHCKYMPGELSTCAIQWPGYKDTDGYVQHCFEKAQ